MLFEDVFEVDVIDPEGKMFERVSRIVSHGEREEMDLVLDVHSELYPLKAGDKFNCALAGTLNLVRPMPLLFSKPSVWCAQTAAASRGAAGRGRGCGALGERHPTL
jgi:hypothetical protein